MSARFCYSKDGGSPDMFYIRSQLNGKVLDVAFADPNPGARVQMFNKTPGSSNNQLWYLDKLGNIRSGLNHFVLDASSGNFQLNPYDISNSRQQWTVSKDRIVNKLNTSEVMDLKGESSRDCADLVPYKYHGKANQLWLFDHVKSAQAPDRSVQEKQYFFIRSHHNGKVLDISGGVGNPGDKVIMYTRHSPPSNNQLWYQDGNGIIRSKLNDLALDSTSGKFVVSLYDTGNLRQQWLYGEHKVYNAHIPKEVLDIKGASKRDLAELVPYGFKNANNQLWTLDYV